MLHPRRPALDSVPGDSPHGGRRLRWLAPIFLNPELVIAIFVSILPVVLLGRLHADEVYQWLEPAFARAHGFGDLGWEWEAGLRNWAVPLLFSWILRAGMALGLDHPVVARALLAIPHALLAFLVLRSVTRWAARRVDAGHALLAAWLFGTYGLFVLFAGRSMAETYSAAALVIAVEKVDARSAFTGGLWMGLSIVFRYPSMVLVAGIALALLLWHRPLFWRAFAGGATVIALLGVLDWVTWGRPYHSLFVYLDFNVLTDKATRAFGAFPNSDYATYVYRVAPWMWAGAAWALWRERDGWIVVPPIVLYVTVLLLTPHKEPRFLYPAILLLGLVGASGWLQLVDSTPRWRTGLLIAGLVASPTSYFLFQKSLRGDLFRGVVRASQQRDTTGVLVAGEDRWDVGGYFFVGRKIPYELCPDAVSCATLFDDSRFNYVVTRSHDLAKLSEAHGFALFSDGKTRVLKRAGPAAGASK